LPRQLAQPCHNVLIEMADIERKDVLETGFKAFFGPVQDLFLKLTGPAAEEYGLMWQDSVKIRRDEATRKGLG
jgi:hypothetical protein